jgi:DNA invertase Pin-like site-specific DNA recombinase
MATNINKGKQTAIIFVRCSSSGYQINRQDTTRQIADLEAYAKYSNLKVVKVFEEHISGGKRNNERPVLQEAIEYCKQEKIAYCLVNALDRLGRNAFEVLATVKELIDNGINLYMQKEQLTLLDDLGKPTMFAPIMIATLSTCAQLERDSIAFRLNSGKKLALEEGRCVLGRKKGSVKTREQKEKEYKDVLMYLNKGYSIRVISQLTRVSVATVQRLKNEFIRSA